MKNIQFNQEQGSNVIRKKAYEFAVDIVNFCKCSNNDRLMNPLITQLLRSGTSIGANIEEAQQSESRKDFIHKLKISLKEAYEVRYWLSLLGDTDSSIKTGTDALIEKTDEIIRLLVSITKTLKSQQE